MKFHLFEIKEVKISFSLFAFIFAFSFTSIAFAAEFTSLANSPATPEELWKGSCTHTMTGEIVSGDSKRLIDLIKRLPGQDHDADNFLLCLDSIGGNLTEGLAIGKVVQQNRFGTYISESAECLSACAIVFMHGLVNYFDDYQTFRMLHPKGKLGFHAPSLNLGRSGTVPMALVHDAYRTAIMTIADLTVSASSISSSQTKIATVPLSLLAELLRTDPAHMMYVDTLHKAFMWGIDINPHGLKTPSDFSLELGCRQLCENALYKIEPDSIPIGSIPTVTKEASDWDESVAQMTKAPSPETHTVLRFTDMRERQCAYKFNKTAITGSFNVLLYLDGNPRGEADLPPIYLFNPKLQITQLANAN
ncbi:MAG: hypothetical protein AAF197_11800 [Pseudomonadota bacterium]